MRGGKDPWRVPDELTDKSVVAERDLWSAVLTRAALDYLYLGRILEYGTCPEEFSQDDYQTYMLHVEGDYTRAIGYFTHSGTEVGSFKWICHALGFNHKVVRKKIFDGNCFQANRDMMRNIHVGARKKPVNCWKTCSESKLRKGIIYQYVKYF